MPYFSIETNQTIDTAEAHEIVGKASSLIAALLGKPESFVMVAVRPETAMSFGGTPAPAAFVRLKSIGLAADRCAEFSDRICAFVDQELGVPKERVFIEFKALERQLFGWNGKTF